MSDPEIQLQVAVSLMDQANADEVDRLTRRLLFELQEDSSFAFARLAETTIPTGSKGAGTVTLGSLFVGLLPSAIPKLIAFLQSWLKQDSERMIRIKAVAGDTSFEIDIPVDALDREEVEMLVKQLSRPVTRKDLDTPKKARK